jgi:hypothetical protein
MVRFEDEAQGLLDHVYGGSVRMQPDFLRVADRKDILVRLLANLKGNYLNRATTSARWPPSSGSSWCGRTRRTTSATAASC